MTAETADMVRRLLAMDASATPEERARVAAALLPAEDPAAGVLSAGEAARRLGRTTARVRQLAAAGILRRRYGGYDEASVEALRAEGLPVRPRRLPRRDGRGLFVRGRARA